MPERIIKFRNFIIISSIVEGARVGAEYIYAFRRDKGGAKKF